MEPAPAHATTVVIGAGIIGSAVAMHLAEAGDPGVACIDPDLAGERSSSQLNAGGVRATWWRPVNIDLCARTIDVLAANAEEVGFRPRGYLWLYGPELWEGARAHVALQNRRGREVEMLSPADVAARWPFIDRLEGIAGATFSPKDGLVDPNAVRERYRRRARQAGVRFVDRCMLAGAERPGPGRVRLRVARPAGRVDALDALLAPPATGEPGDLEVIACERVVNAAGPWAAWVAELLGYSVPCRAVPRQVSIIASRDVDLSAHGMIVDTSGCYFHHEGGELILAGYSPPGDPPGHDFDHEGRAFFEREIWPRLAARSTRFDRLEHVRGWTGLYELSPDNSALLGAVTGAPDTFEIHSFSGRGVMQSDAAARALAELMTTGAFQTADASALTGRRFATGDLQPEELHI
jgi:glycine/D-amino acid oxidase-like deaminating enzyme